MLPHTNESEFTADAMLSEFPGWTCARCGRQNSLAVRTCPVDGTELEREFKPRSLVGYLIGHSLHVIDYVASGGFGHVYFAKNRLTNARRVVKLLMPHAVVDGEVVERFNREAEIAESLAHPNIVVTHDFGQLQGVPFIVMEHVQGESLRVLLRREKTISAKRCAAIIEQIASALTYAHGLNVIHRDLTPNNIIVDRRSDGADWVKVIDFGLAKVLGKREHRDLTAPNVSVGTPPYMSPEHAFFSGFSIQSDVFAFGMVTIEMLAGELPVNAGEYVDAEADDPYGIEQLEASKSWSAELRSVLKRGISARKRERYQTATEFANDVKASLGMDDAPLNPARVSATTPNAPHTAAPASASASAGRTNARISTRKAASITTAVIAAGALSVYILYAAQARNDEKFAAGQTSTSPLIAKPIREETAVGNAKTGHNRVPRPQSSAAPTESIDASSTTKAVDFSAEIDRIDDMSRGTVISAAQAMSRSEALLPKLTTASDSVAVQLMWARAAMRTGLPSSACTQARAIEQRAEDTRWRNEVASAIDSYCR